MAIHELDLADFQTIREDISLPSEVVGLRGLLRLRQLDDDGLWSPAGTFTTASFLLHTWEPKARTAFIGFCAFVQEPANTAVLFRLATDEDAPLFWDGSSWALPATDTEWNTDAEIDAGIASFPVNCAIKVHVKLQSTDGVRSPAILGFAIFWELNYSPQRDAVESLYQKLIDEVRVEGEWCDVLVDPTTSLCLDDRLFDIADPVEVFNLDNDPCMQTNLLASRIGGAVELSSPQTGEILVRYRGRLTSVHIASDADFTREQLPAVVIRNVDNPRVRDFHREFVEEPLRSQGIVRLRTLPSRHEYKYNLVCSGFDDLTCKKLADAVRRAFDEKEFVTSLALDEDQPVVSLENVNQANRVEDQLFERTIPVSLSVLEWMSAHRDVPMTKDITLRVRPYLCQQLGTPE